MADSQPNCAASARQSRRCDQCGNMFDLRADMPKHLVARTKVEKANLLEHESVHQQVADFNSSRLDPVKDIIVILAAVAASTCWQDVSRRCSSASRYRNNMIPRIGGRTAICALAVKKGDQESFSLVRNGVNSTLSLSGVLFASQSKCRVGSIALAPNAVDAGFTFLLLERDLFNRKPRLAVTTPSKATRSLPTNLCSAWKIASNSRTVSAFRAEAIVSAVVDVIALCFLPRLALGASLESRRFESKIFFDGNACLASGNFSGAEFSLSHTDHYR